MGQRISFRGRAIGNKSGNKQANMIAKEIDEIKHITSFIQEKE